jgi:hypothetical protein
VKLNRKTRWQLRRKERIAAVRRMVVASDERYQKCLEIKAPNSIVRMAKKRIAFWMVRLSDNIGNTQTPWPRTTPRPRQNPPWKRNGGVA